jgi:hypothetical protein
MLRERPVRPHEDQDVSVGVVLAAAGLLVLTVVLVVVVAFLLDAALSVSRGGPAPQPAAGRAQDTADRTGVLSLSGTPQADLAAIRRVETERLESRGWVDRQAGVVHIPIGDAMDILAQRGLPARPDEPPRQVAAPSAAGRFVDAGR